MIKKIFIVLISVAIISNPVLGISLSYLDNPSPDCGEEGVEITPKGVQICINVTLNPGCSVNLSFQYWDWDEYWLDPFYDGTWFGNYTGINTSGQYCFWNDNVTCYTEGDWESWWHWWRVIANFTCPQSSYDEIFYCDFFPEECPLFYIYPPHNESSVCPCCDRMCVGINNELGHSMNLTFFRNDSLNETFYIINKYFAVSNGTYCFCIDGHIGDIYYPMKFNETYHWYINVTDTQTGTGNISRVFNFTTAGWEYCFCGNFSEAYNASTCGRSSSLGIIGVVGILGLIGWFMVRKRLLIKKEKK